MEAVPRGPKDWEDRSEQEAPSEPEDRSDPPQLPPAETPVDGHAGSSISGNAGSSHTSGNGRAPGPGSEDDRVQTPGSAAESVPASGYDDAKRAVEDEARRAGGMSPEDIEDATQAGWFEVLRRRGIRNPIGFIRVYSRRFFRDLRRKRSNRSRITNMWSNELMPREAGTHDFPAELSARIEKLIASLDEAEQTLLHGRYYLELSYAEIAERRLVPEISSESGVRARMDRIMRKLERQL